MHESFDDQNAEPERYELREPPPYHFAANRREFTQSLGAGLLVAVSLRESQGQRRGRSSRRVEMLAERFHLGVNGVITVLTSKVEVGQGSRTQITQAAAEELRMPIDRIELIMADSQRCPDDGGTAGSRTTPSTVPRVRAAAAALRELLFQFASDRWNVTADRIRFSEGVLETEGQQRILLADLAGDEELQGKLEATSAADEGSIVPVDQWKVLGTSVDKIGGREVVTGAAIYPSDVRRPEMLYGKVLRPVSYNAQLTAADLSVADRFDGVRVVRDGDFIGCTAATSWQAGQALDAIAGTCQWERPSHPPSDRLYDHLKETAREDARRRRGGEEVDSDDAVTGSNTTLESRYTIAYVQHAPMEPRAAVAEWEGGKLTVWTGTQQPSRVHRELCEVFRLPADSVRVVVPDTGGGFGGKHTGEVAVEAARLSRAAERPVSLRWTREEEFTWAYFRPCGLIEVSASVDAAGNCLSWDFTNYNSGGSAIETPYRVPKRQTRFVNCDPPLRQGSYRALASTANTFARESAMDELAALSKQDPLTFRLMHLDDGRLKDVLRAAADRFGWNDRRRAKAAGRGVGLACGTEKGSFVAACAEVEVVDGEMRIVEVCQVFECGAIQNPSNLRSQHAGCLVMGLGGAVMEAVEFADGRVTNSRFSAYRVPRMRDVPKLDLMELDRPDLPSVGAGETPIIAVAPAIANAVAHATGKRSRSMPLKLS